MGGREARDGQGSAMKKLLTGAAGIIGTTLRPALRERYEHVRLFDISPITNPASGEEVVPGDISDLEQVMAASSDIDCVVHFAGIPNEAPWERILSVNIIGTYNAFEAAYRQGARRVVFASSNHVIGFHRSDRRVGVDALPRPDSCYGVSKVFGESVARLYADKHGLEAVVLRYGSVRARPEAPRQLATWCSYRDAVALALKAIEAPNIHFAVAYGVSANARNRWGNEGAELLGYEPRDNAEDFAGEILGRDDAADEISRAFHGGPYCAEEFDGLPERIY
jgi:uronate dehydrogenase